LTFTSNAGMRPDELVMAKDAALGKRAIRQPSKARICAEREGISHVEDFVVGEKPGPFGWSKRAHCCPECRRASAEDAVTGKGKCLVVGGIAIGWVG